MQYPATEFVLLISLVVFHLSRALGQPPRQECYQLRYHVRHSYCLRKSPACFIGTHKVSSEDKQLILGLHNEYRVKVAKGRNPFVELPEAADMLQMEWDDDLAETAKGHAFQCKFEHDCPDCRRLRDYSVGQNIMQRSFYLEMSEWPRANWRAVIREWHREATNFNPNSIDSFRSDEHNGTVHHFAQLIWAKTWRIGCSYVLIPDSDVFHQLYVCNYGPEGAVEDEPVYTVGPPCSKCPLNACCGPYCEPDDTKKTITYDGLCNLQGQRYPKYAFEDVRVFSCQIGDYINCPVSTPNGLRKWVQLDSHSGPYARVLLNGGEWSALNFTRNFKAEDPSCLHISYRKGPNYAGDEGGKGIGKIHFYVYEDKFNFFETIEEDTMDFQLKQVPLPYDSDFKFSVTFHVSRGAPEQYMEIKDVHVAKGDCPDV